MSASIIPTFLRLIRHQPCRLAPDALKYLNIDGIAFSGCYTVTVIGKSRSFDSAGKNLDVLGIAVRRGIVLNPCTIDRSQRGVEIYGSISAVSFGRFNTL